MTDEGERALEITGRLTEAQKRAISAATLDWPMFVGRPRTLRALANVGLCWPPKIWEINRTHVLARPLGLAVRALLEQRNAD